MPSPAATSGVHDPQSFDHLPARFDRLAVLIGAELRAWLLFHLPLSGNRALDAGCGTGVHTELLADRHNEVLAVDLSTAMLTHACRHRPRGNIRYERRDLLDVGAAQDGRFDVVLSAYTLHHLPDLATAFAHLRSLVRPGGTVLLVDVVDDRHPTPRAWLRAEAWRAFRGDLLSRRPPSEAVELLRLQLDPDWLDHQATDQLTPADHWEALARAAYPDARITPLHRSRALAWRAPTP